MKLFVGLGNPGSAYAHNRHNVGFRCINRFSRAYRIPLEKRWARARVGVGEVAGSEVVLAKPQTFVNLSGESVALLVQRFGISVSDLFVIHDDLDLPLGRIRIGQGGSSGGHKGVASIISSLGGQNFPRIRVGIGRPGEEWEHEVINFVLSDFTPGEMKVIDEAISRVADAMYCILTEGIARAMNEYN